MNAAVHWTTLGAMVLCGIGLGMLFDVYRVVSRRLRVPRWLLPMLDLLYWVLGTTAVFRTLLHSNHGEVRLYVFLGLGIGITGYFGIFSTAVLKLTGWLFDVIRKLVLGIWRLIRILILTPFLWIVRALARLLDVVFLITAALLLWTIRLLLKPLRRPGRWLWAKLMPVRVQARKVGDTFQALIERVKQIWDLLRKKL